MDSEQVGREGLASKFIGLRMPRLFWSKAISHAVCKKHEGAGVLRVWHEMFDVKVIFTLKLKTK